MASREFEKLKDFVSVVEAGEYSKKKLKIGLKWEVLVLEGWKV